MRAGIVNRPEKYKWSSAKAHLQGENDILVKIEPLAAIVNNWQELLLSDLTEEEYKTIRLHERTGRPAGGEDFLDKLESMTARLLRKQKPGPKTDN